LCARIGPDVEVASYNHAVYGPDLGRGSGCILGEEKSSMWPKCGLDLFCYLGLNFHYFRNSRSDIKPSKWAAEGYMPLSYTKRLHQDQNTKDNKSINTDQKQYVIR